jgi:hypothetical protein
MAERFQARKAIYVHPLGVENKKGRQLQRPGSELSDRTLVSMNNFKSCTICSAGCI